MFADPAVARRTAAWKAITVTPIGAGRSAHHVLRVQSSDLNDETAPIIVKVGARAECAQERDANLVIVNPALPRSIRPEMLAHAEAGELGALAFTAFAGNTLTQHLAKGDLASLHRVMHHLLPHLTASWYAPAARKPGLSLSVRYADRFFKPQNAIARAVNGGAKVGHSAA